jgi:ketosteroid isomerase-like protein
MTQQVDARFARQFLQRLHAAVNVHDAAGIAALCCEDILWDDSAAPEPLRGREAVYRFHHDTMFRALPDASVGDGLAAAVV